MTQLILRPNFTKNIYKHYIQKGKSLNIFGAKDKVEEYNKWKEKVEILKTSSAKYIKRRIINHKKIPNGTYYFVLVSQSNIDIQTLLNNIKIIYKKNYLDAFKSKIPKE